MKAPLIATLAVYLALAGLAWSDMSPINLRVEPRGQREAGKSASVDRQGFKVVMSNASRQDYPGLKVRYSYFTRDLKTRAATLLRKGEVPAELKSLNSTIVEIPPLEAKKAEPKPVKTSGKKGEKPAEEKPALEDPFFAFSVEVVDSAGKTLAELFEPAALKQEIAAK